ncbi:serine/threonine protein kinase [Streptomyces sp. NPDC001700]
MEPLRSDDPRRIGPYDLVARFDTEEPGASGRVAVPERRFIGRLPGGNRTVVISTPLPGADAARFAVEAEAARRRLAGDWIAPVADLGGTGEALWYASPYLPALPLPGALAAHGGPLPERTVRAVGAALAEALAAAHAWGVTHGGVSPGAVLLTADGPWLTCFGAHRSGPPGAGAGSLPPEQVAGGQTLPPGDIYALGSVLAYAATGHTVPERRELPEGLRTTIARCLARDPASRPQGGRLLAELTRTEEAPAGSGAVAALGPGWLPGAVIGALVRQSAELLAVETDVAGGPVAGGETPGGPSYEPTALGRI